MKLDSDALQLMIFYEKDFIDSALSIADSFKYYIKSNNVLSDQVIKNQTEFIRYVRLLLKHKHSGIDNYTLKKIKKEILSNNTLRRRNWLISKLDEINKI